MLSFRPFLLSSLFLLLLGWGGLYLLVNFTLPTVWPRWAFFASLVVALTATAFPIVYFISTRFLDQPLQPSVLVRRALWVGVYGAVLAWLQLARLVNLYVIVGLAGGLILIEYLLRLRERALWQAPELPDDDQPT